MPPAPAISTRFLFMARSAALAIFAESPAVGPRAGMEGDGWAPSKEGGMLAHGPGDPRALAAG